MTDHADTIRRALDGMYVPSLLRAEALSALDALVAERQQAIDERDRANEAFTAQVDLRHDAQVRCEQAIDALRDLNALTFENEDDEKCVREVIAAALVSLGETE